MGVLRARCTQCCNLIDTNQNNETHAYILFLHNRSATKQHLHPQSVVEIVHGQVHEHDSIIWSPYTVLRADVSASCACLSCSLAFLLLYVVFLSKSQYSTVVLTVVRVMIAKYRKSGIWGYRSSVTSEPIELKYCVSDYVDHRTQHAPRGN